VFFWAVVSDEIDEVIEFFPTRRQAERMLAEALQDEPDWSENLCPEKIELRTGTANQKNLPRCPALLGCSGGSLGALMTGRHLGGVRERPLEDDNVTVLLFYERRADRSHLRAPTAGARASENSPGHVRRNGREADWKRLGTDCGLQSRDALRIRKTKASLLRGFLLVGAPGFEPGTSSPPD
jgi:hypothetical protein